MPTIEENDPIRRLEILRQRHRTAPHQIEPNTRKSIPTHKLLSHYTLLL